MTNEAGAGVAILCAGVTCAVNTTSISRIFFGGGSCLIL